MGKHGFVWPMNEENCTKKSSYTAASEKMKISKNSWGYFYVVRFWL